MKNAVLIISLAALQLAGRAQETSKPLSMDFPATYDEIASLEFLAGDREKAAAYESKAIASAEDGKHTGDQLEKYRNNLRKYL